MFAEHKTKANKIHTEIEFYFSLISFMNVLKFLFSFFFLLFVFSSFHFVDTLAMT